LTGWRIFSFKLRAKSHRSQHKGYDKALVELQNVVSDLVTDSPHLGRARSAHTPFNSHGLLKATNLPKYALLRIQWLRLPRAFNVVKGMVVVEAVTIVERHDDLPTLAELISTPSLELLHLQTVNDTNMENFTSNATKRGTVTTNARS
jgi:hypothetical protein